MNEQILVAVWSDSLLTEAVTDVCHSICCPVLTMILLQDQFDDIIGKSDLDNLNQISIYHNSNSRNSNKYYDNSNKCYDITNIGYSHR